jgi:hypothetical protein
MATYGLPFFGGKTRMVEGLTGAKPLIFLVAKAEMLRRPKKFQPFQFSADADVCFVLKSGRSKRRYDCHISVKGLNRSRGRRLRAGAGG